MSPDQLLNLVIQILDDKKAVDILSIDMRTRSPLMDYVVIASGSSSRHVVSLADALELDLRKTKADILSVQGKEEGEWVLVDLNDVVVHLFKPDVRTHYDLEKIWALEPTRTEQSSST